MYKVYERLRDEKGLTDASIASALGFSSTTLYDWRDGKYQPKLDKLIKIAEFFGVTIDAFINGESDEQD